jgi:valyl-tRNA synthetase
MEEEIPKAYDPKVVEEKQYQFWLQGGFFKASAQTSKKPYTIVMPPPNVTGVLHCGHALVSTIQDILIRWKRMCGFEALWVPGTDHAGIATQTVVERHLLKTLGKRRTDFTREEFLKHVWDWKTVSEAQILDQIKRLGASCDWDRLAFTMDEKRSKAVRTMFKKMFDEGLIYRGDYLVNWDPLTQTALADDEVEYEEREGFLYYIRYPLVESDQSLVVATTRPETLLGDTAVAVSPEDIRYQLFIGKQIEVPITGRKVPVIGDALIDQQFGTGAVKITPAHDPNDYALAERHHLPMINIMTPDGKINENGKEFQGLSMEAARGAIIEKLKKLGFLEKVEKHTHRVGLSYRSKAVIEPYLSKQWFVKVSHFKNQLIELVRSKKVRLVPENFENTYFHWIHNLRDWCISRQLWWGHRIPIWYKKDDPTTLLCSADEMAPDPALWVQDPDVLDTWFSSALWPFSVLGWPEKTPDLKTFFPTSVLVTGYDILFFWVARMMLMGQEALQTPPFSIVFLHGLIFGKSYWRHASDGSIAYALPEERHRYDQGEAPPPEVQSRWEKMSKSKGNIIDPIEIIDSFGADALRMALAASTTHARQIDLDHRRFEEFKNFANKVWNGARFVFLNLNDLDIGTGLDLHLLALEDKWILSRLNRILCDVNASLTEFAFDKAALSAYDFFWKEFCAYYVELTKPYLFGKRGTPAEKSSKQKILLVVLCCAIRLLHPMAPFITEELFQLLKKRFPTLTSTSDPYTQETLQALQAPACIVSPYPTTIRPSDQNPDVEEAFDFLTALVHAIRNIRAEMQVPPGTPTELFLTGPADRLTFIENHHTILHALVRLSTISFGTLPSALASTALVGDIKISIPLPLEMKEREKGRLVKEKEKLIIQEQTTRAKLANPDFIAKAPPPLVDKLRSQLDQVEKDLVTLSQKMELLNGEL